MTAALEVEHLGVRYGGVVAIDDVSLVVPAGAISGLIGPNGAGKTSFLDAVSGFAIPTTGRVRLDGRACDGLGPHDYARAGLARTFQALELFDDLTVEENLVVAATRPRWWSVLRDLFGPGRPTAALSDAIDDAVTLCSLADLVRRMPSELSNGERHRVARRVRWSPSPRCCSSTNPAPASTRPRPVSWVTSSGGGGSRNGGAAGRPRHGAGARNAANSCTCSTEVG